MLVQTRLVLTIDGHRWAPFRATRDLLSIHVDVHIPFLPTDSACPAGCDQHFPAAPPIARIDDQIANFPSFVVDDEIVNMADLFIAALNLVSSNFIDTAQVDITCIF